MFIEKLIKTKIIFRLHQKSNTFLSLWLFVMVRQKNGNLDIISKKGNFFLFGNYCWTGDDEQQRL